MDYSSKEDIIECIYDRLMGFIMPSESNNYKSRFLQSGILMYCVVLLLVLKIFTILAPINLPHNVFFADITKSSLEVFINQSRQSLGLPTLSENNKLDRAAQLKAENMVQNQYFDHVSPSGVTPWFWFLKAGYKYKYAGENLAIGFYDSQEVYNAWLNSPSHKANILNPNYTEVGTAVLKGFGQNNSIVVVQEFGSQLPAKSAVAKQTGPEQNITQTGINEMEKNIEVSPSSDKSGERVLSQSTQGFIESPKSGNTSNLPIKILNSVLYSYDGLLQDIIYGFSLVVMGILLTLIFFNFKIDFHRELVFRAALIVVLLSAATLLNRETIVALIPHSILI